MRDFTYYAPTRVFFGKGKEDEVGRIVAEYGFKKVMLQHGKDSIKRSGLYDRVVSSLKEYGIDIIDFGGVEPNPKVSFVREAIKTAKEQGAELILAVGGGSTIDSAKATAAGALYDGDVWDFNSGKATPEDALPVGCILTHSAAGSEMSGSAVLTNMELNMKRGFNTEFNRCLFAICNPELTYTVSKYQTACGVVDIMAHTMERYFTPCAPTPVTDSIAESILRCVIDGAKKVMDKPDDYDARATIMWASSLSHNDLTGCGRDNKLAVHQLEHALSGEYDHIAHGAGLAVLFPAWARFVYKENIPRFAQFARNVWGVTESDDARAALCGIEAMAEFFASIGMPLTIRECGVSAEDTAVLADRLANLCTFGKSRTIRSYIELNYDNIKEIFESCY